MYKTFNVNPKKTHIKKSPQTSKSERSMGDFPCQLSILYHISYYQAHSVDGYLPTFELYFIHSCRKKTRFIGRPELTPVGGFIEIFAGHKDQPKREAGLILTVGGFNHLLGGGFKYFIFSPLCGEDSHFDQYFSDGLKPPTSLLCSP